MLGKIKNFVILTIYLSNFNQLGGYICSFYRLRKISYFLWYSHLQKFKTSHSSFCNSHNYRNLQSLYTQQSCCNESSH